VKVEASFVTSAVSVGDLLRGRLDGAAGVALVGRSNVGKSSLINALARTRIARSSAVPGKTRLANVYRMARGTAAPLHVIDLPGYGFASGARAVNRLTAKPGRGEGRQAQVSGEPGFDDVARAVFTLEPAALLLVDARHPGLDSDRNAWRWLRQTVSRTAVVATKIDKLARGERIRAMGQLESVFEDAVLPVSAATGEGLDELWKLIDRLVNTPRNSSSPSRPLPQPRSRAAAAPEATAPRPTRVQARRRRRR
jgi:GTP-binding protein